MKAALIIVIYSKDIMFDDKTIRLFFFRQQLTKHIHPVRHSMAIYLK